MAHIAKRETSMRRNGRPVVRWVVRWDEAVRHPNGMPVKTTDRQGVERAKTTRRERTFPTETETKAFLATVAHDKAQGTERDYRAAETPLGHFAAAWLDSVRAKVGKPGGLKPKTFESYEGAIRNRIVPAFAHRPVGSVTLLDCDRFAGDLERAGLSATSIRTVLGVFRRVLAYAVRAGAIQSSPAALMELPTARKLGEDFEPYVLTPDDVARTVAGLSNPHDLLVLFAVGTGLRQGEQAALDVADVTVERVADGWVGSVSVTKTAEKVKGGWRVHSPKSKRSRRTVPLPSWLAEEMAAYLGDHPRRDDPTAPLWPGRARGGLTHGTDRGTTRHGAVTYATRWEPTAFVRTVFRPALEAAGLPATSEADSPGVRWHDLRHTFATTALANGVPVMQVSHWLGHASYVVTMTVYAHWIPSETERHIDRIARPGATVKPDAVVSLKDRRVGHAS